MIFFASDKILAFSFPKLELWKTCIQVYEFNSFPLLKDFSYEFGNDVNEYDFLNIIKCVNIWEICIIQRTNIFQVLECMTF